MLQNKQTEYVLFLYNSISVNINKRKFIRQYNPLETLFLLCSIFRNVIILFRYKTIGMQTQKTVIKFLSLWQIGTSISNFHARNINKSLENEKEGATFHLFTLIHSYIL